MEDDVSIAGMYSTKLNSAGYTVRHATDGKTGLAMLEEKTPDLLLLDIVMPRLDGFDVLKKIKKNHQLVDLKIILLTNLGQKNDREVGLKLGADDYIVKAHVTPKDVVDQVNSILNEKEPATITEIK